MLIDTRRFSERTRRLLGTADTHTNDAEAWERTNTTQGDQGSRYAHHGSTRMFELDNDCGLSFTEASHGVRSSTCRLAEYRMVPSDVCDAKQPVLRTAGGPEVDVTVAARPSGWVARVVALSIVRASRRPIMASARRSAGCVSTVWYHPTCVMPNSRCSGRFVGRRPA